MRAKELSRLRDASFGGERLFASPAPDASPVPFAEFAVPAWDGLPAGTAAASWKHVAAEGGHGALPSVHGFLREHGANTCFALSVLQVLLRLPAFAVWLQRHGGIKRIRRPASAPRVCAKCSGTHNPPYGCVYN